MSVDLSIVICTFNRPKELDLCLRSIAEFGHGYFHRIEVLVIDNAQQKTTLEICNSIKLSCELRYIPCSNIGLSHSRNEGSKAAIGDYVLYIDDDAKLMPNTLKEEFIMIDEYDFDIFGGGYIPYYHADPPAWLDADFGRLKFDQSTIGLSSITLNGSNFTCKKSIFDSISFDPAYGMTGEKIGYGEETYFQLKAKELGYTVGFNPNLMVEHLVAPYKYSLRWQLESLFYKGYYSNFIQKSLFNKIKILLKDLIYYVPAGFVVAIRDCIFPSFSAKKLFFTCFASVMVTLGRIVRLSKNTLRMIQNA